MDECARITKRLVELPSGGAPWFGWEPRRTCEPCDWMNLSLTQEFAWLCKAIPGPSTAAARLVSWRSGSSASQPLAKIFVSLVFLSVNRLFSLMQTLTAVQLVFCSAAFQKKKRKEKSSPKSLDPLSFQTRIAVWNCFQSASAPYNGPAMCKPGSSKTYTSPLPRTGLSQGVFCTKAAPAHFPDLCNLFPRTRWVMTDDKRQVQPINRGWRSVRGNGH